MYALAESSETSARSRVSTRSDDSFQNLEVDRIKVLRQRVALYTKVLRNLHILIHIRIANINENENIRENTRVGL